VLGELGVGPEATTAGLVEALGSTDDDVSRAAARSLGMLGPATIPAIGKALESPDEKLRRRAAESLGWMGPAAAQALADALKNSNAEVRRIAARSLGRLGAAAKSYAPALLEAASDRDQAAREAAAEALKQVEAPPATEGSGT
jgi:HEAT repeat protein